MFVAPSAESQEQEQEQQTKCPLSFITSFSMRLKKGDRAEDTDHCVVVARSHNSRSGRSKKTWESSSDQEVKELAEEDLPNYTIHDVVLPLPGFNVDYPGGTIKELYEKILKADGLDMHRMRREQRSVLRSEPPPR